MHRGLYEMMKEITDWQDSVFTEATPKSAAIHLKREAIEVLDTVIHHSSVGLDLELADVFLLTVAVAHLSGIDLEEAIERKMFHNRNRAWGAPDAEGVVEHVREKQGKTLVEVFSEEQINIIKNILMEDTE